MNPAAFFIQVRPDRKKDIKNYRYEGYLTKEKRT